MAKQGEKETKAKCTSVEGHLIAFCRGITQPQSIRGEKFGEVPEEDEEQFGAGVKK